MNPYVQKTACVGERCVLRQNGFAATSALECPERGSGYRVAGKALEPRV